MKSLSLIAICIFLIGPLSVHAEPDESMNTLTLEPVDSTPLRFKHVLAVNFIPLIGAVNKSPGLGLGYQYVLNSHYSVGANVAYKKQTSSSNDFPDVATFQFINVGVEGRYKFSSFSEDGLYAGLGLVSSGIKGDVEMRNVFGGPSQNVGTSYQWSGFVVPRVGYLWVPNAKQSYWDFSVGYEPLDDSDYSIDRPADTDNAVLDIARRKVGVKLSFLAGWVF